MADLRVDIAAEFTGKKAFDKAKKSTSGLEKGVKQLGKAFAAAFAAKKIIAFGKASVKAFADDQKGATQLAKVVDNLGLSFANPSINAYIEKLSLATAVTDDQLRPAFQSLLTTTGSLTNSQKMLADAIDISAGSGVDLATVSQDLANAYVGNTKGLKKYNIGLTQAELKTASFATIQEKLTKQFSGSNAAYLTTYAGQMQLLSTRAGEAQETIGGGLIDAFNILAGNDSLTGLSDTMATIAENTANFFRGLAKGFKDLAAMPIIKQLLGLTGAILRLLGSPFIQAGATIQAAKLAPASSNAFLTEHQAPLDAKRAKAAEAAAKKRNAELAKATKGNTAELKKQALAKKQSALFDLEQIGIVAGLKRNISEDDQTRLKLQLALLTGNDKEADVLSQKLAMSQDATGKLAKSLRELPDANNPFKSWDAFLDGIIKKAKEAAAAVGTADAQIIAPSNLPDTVYNKGTYVPSSGYMPQSSNIPDTNYGANTYIPSSGYQAPSVTVNNHIAGSVTSDQAIIDLVLRGTQTASLSGSPSQIGRINGLFN